MARRCLIFFTFALALFLSGCATAVRKPAIVSPIEHPRPAPLGTIGNPIIDSDITLAEALRKWAPEKIKRRQQIVDVLYYSFDGKVHKGQIVVDKRLAGDIQEVFQVALETRFPIKSVIPISHHRFYKDGEWNSDGQSMFANNTSGFNYRKATGKKTLSMHSYGYAVDINPVQNPYIKRRRVLPPGARYDVSRPGTLTRNCQVTQAFLRLGWIWGGDWKSLKDYQHFEKVLPK